MREWCDVCESHHAAGTDPPGVRWLTADQVAPPYGPDPVVFPPPGGNGISAGQAEATRESEEAREGTEEK